MLPTRLLSPVVLLCLVALTGCSGHHAPAPDGLVPWTDQPAEAAALARSTTSAPCDVSALRVPRGDQQWGGVWNGAVAGYLMIENAGPRPCDLPRPSRVSAETTSGARITFDVGGLSVPAVTLEPGNRVQVQISSPYDCGKPLVRSAGFSLAFPTGTLEVRGARMAVQCGGSLVDFSARDVGTSARGTTSAPPVSRLDATMSRVPATISPGSSVGYAVTLTNPTSTAIALDQCPAYQEGIKGRPSSVQTYQLNCDAVRRIDPHTSVTFEMQLPVPTQVPSGPIVLDWELQVPARAVDEGQFTSAGTRVE